MSATCSELLERYEEMWRMSQQMLAAARHDEWDRLLELGQAQTRIVDHLQQADTIAWQAFDALKKGELIQAILASDREIKTLTQSWMEELQETLGRFDLEKKLKKAYQSP